MKNLFVGDLNNYGRGYQRSCVLSELVSDLTVLSHTKIARSGEIFKPSLVYRIFWKLRIPIDFQRVNRKILNLLSKDEYSWIWIDNPNNIYPWTLIYIRHKYPNVKIISFSEDDMYVKHGHSIWYRLGIRFYHIVYTTKTHNLSELKLFGARDVRLTLDCFNKNLHAKMTLTPKDIQTYGCDISAIGAYEKDRAQTLIFLAKKGLKVSVWGSGWAGLVGFHPNLDVKNQFLFGKDYVRAICASLISINFLRKINRDQITSRSMEIPACEVLMIAERTERHMLHFREGIEAEFFDSCDELFKKIKYYLKNESARSLIAKNGRLRCVTSGYSMHDQYSKIINEISEKK